MAFKVYEKEQVLLDQIQRQIDIIRDTSKYKEFLDMSARLHRYSFQNLCLIYWQCPQASIVGGMKNFWNPMRRFVRKGERGLQILAPLIKKVPVDGCNREVMSVDGDCDLFEKDEFACCRKVNRIYGYKTVHVFDLSQTDGEPMPDICKPLIGQSEYYVLFKQFVQDKGFDVVEKPIKANGNTDAKTVWINSDRDELQKIKTLIHEYSHIVHGHLKILHMDSDVNVLELQAESTAYLVCKWLGLDTSTHSFEYMASWTEGMDKQVFEKAVDLALAVAKQVFSDFMRYSGLEKDIVDTSEESLQEEERRVA
jgi:hypothetical protein